MRGLLLLLGATLGQAATDEATRKYAVVTPRNVDFIATGINVRGDVVGFDLVEDAKHPGVIDHVGCFARGNEITHIAPLRGYTATFPAAVSDDGSVVGHVSKPRIPGVVQPLTSQAFLWDARDGIRGLGTADGDIASFASGITRDGRRISGYSIGSNRIRACVWERGDEGWRATVLPHAGRLGCTTVPISSDGRFVAGVDDALPCLWTLDAAGHWSRETIGGPGSLVPRGVNNAGVVVGVRFDGEGNTHAVAWAKTGGLRQLNKPAGYLRAEALAINNRGAIVGMVDGPRGSKTGPNGFVEEGGKLRILTEGGPNLASATAINDRGQVAGVLEAKED